MFENWKWYGEVCMPWNIVLQQDAFCNIMVWRLPDIARLQNVHRLKTNEISSGLLWEYKDPMVPDPNFMEAPKMAKDLEESQRNQLALLRKRVCHDKQVQFQRLSNIFTSFWDDKLCRGYCKIIALTSASIAYCSEGLQTGMQSIHGL